MMVLLVLVLSLVLVALALMLYKTEQAYQERLVVDYGVSICNVKADEIWAGKESPSRAGWSNMQTACLVGVTEQAKREVWAAMTLK